jgi:RNA polymerase sigma-70 factor (ECF subfamily)
VVEAAQQPSEGPDEGARLMLAWQAGDGPAFDALVRLHADRVHSLLVRFLGPHAPLDDLVQEVFLRVIRSKEHYQPSARFTTWLFRIVYNLSVNHTQRRQPQALSIDGGPDEEGGVEVRDEVVADPSDSLQREDIVRAVRLAIESLPERQRMALVLAKYEEQSYSEIGEVLDMTEKAVKSLVHRARENLRGILAPLLTEELL